MSKNDKPSKRRYKAMLEDVAKRVQYAVYSGEMDNPYQVDDKRHENFAKQLAHARWMEAELRDVFEVMGSDTSAWQKRVQPNPGPVVPLERLI